MIKLPKGYIEHNGLEIPVDPEQYVILIIRTSEGLAYEGPIKAKLHDWEQKRKDKLGHIVGYKIAKREDRLADKFVRWPEEEKV